MHNIKSKNRTKCTVYSFGLDEVIVNDAYSVNALEKEIHYLLSLNPDKLTAGFYEMRGKKEKAEKYSGWEDTEIKGHTLGHYLAALAQGYLTTKSKKLLEKLKYILAELKDCQEENGFLFASREEIFDRVENSKPAWVPWYTMHKILAGLIKAYQATGSEDAYHTAARLGDWVYSRTSRWSEEVQNRVLTVEYGGMNDALYDLYQITNSDDHLDAAHMFDEMPLFTAMHQKEDILDGKHANTTIPKILGGLNRYLTLGQEEEFYRIAAENFWDMVVKHHSYITGGNSEWEHFGKPDILDGERTNCNCETCNSYNMLKLTKRLFLVTGNKKYADFYERTLWNSILSSQNPETGMTTYFQPMATGYFKVFGTPYDKFWCCTGTGMENFTKLNDSIYFYKEDCLLINRYISSEVAWKEKQVRIIQNTQLPLQNTADITVKMTDSKRPVSFSIKLRVPDWAAGEITVTLNGADTEYKPRDGYLILHREWKDSDRITLTFLIKVGYSCLPDNKGCIAFTYGPVVLSAGLGREDLRCIQTGVAVDIPAKDMEIKDFLILRHGTLKEWLSRLEEHLVKKPDSLEFYLRGTDEDSKLIFTPHYKQYQERYGIYWEIVETDSEELFRHIRKEKEHNRLRQAIIDKIPLGNDQYELKHSIKGEHTEAGGFEGHRCRSLRENGWVSFDMAVDSSAGNYLCITYCKNDIGKEIQITVDGIPFLKDSLQDDSGNLFYEKHYRIPADMLKGKDHISVRFQNNNEENGIRIWDLLYIQREYDRDTGLKQLTCNGKVILQKEAGYQIIRETEDESVTLKFTPNNPNALVFVEGILIKDSLPRELNIKDKTSILVTVQAENRTDSQNFTITVNNEQK